jgi:hypothetical protein
MVRTGRGLGELKTFDIRDLATDNMSGLCVKSLHADGLGEGKVRLVDGDGGAAAPGARPAQQRHVAHEALGRDEEQLRRARGIAHRHVRPHAKEQMLHGRRLARKRGCDHGVNNASFRADTLFNVEDDLRDGQHL